MTFNEVLQQRARERGTSRAFTFLSPQFEATHMTYGELHEAALRISSGLRACKLVRGARVLVALPPGLDFITAFMGCAYAGYVPVHGPLPRRPLQRVIPRLKTILGDCGITTAIMPSNALPMLGELAVALPELSQVRILWFHDLIGQRASSEVDSLVNEKSILFIQYTSGSLAAPKGVMVSHANVLANCRDIAQPAGSTIVCWLPSFHDFGLIYGILTPIFSGVPSVLMSPSTFLQRPRRWLEAMTEYRGTHTPAPNFAFDLCVRHIDESQRAGLELSSWRTAINAAEPIRAETMRRFVEAFAPCGLSRTVFVPAYGLAEATLMVSHAPECMEVTTARVDRESLRQGRIVPGGSAASAEIVACGVPKSSTEFAIVDPRDQRRLLSDQVGEIWIRGPSIALGYFGKPDETEATFGAYLTSGEGPFLRTGDLGFERAGNLYVTGRLKDMVILNGVNHYPHDIELTVEHCHARIRQGSVVAFAIDTDGAEQLAVVAELQRGSTQPPNEVIEAVRRSVSEVHGAAVAHVVFAKANAIPRTTSGKLRRSATREAFLSGALALAFPNSTAACPTQRADQVQLLDELALHLRRILNRSGHDSLDPSQPIVAYGIDSVVVAELIATVQRKYGVSLEPAELLHASLSDVANRIAGGAPVQPNTKPSKPVAVSFAIAEPEANGRELPESMPSGSTETCFSVFYFGNFTDDAAAYYRLVQQTATLADEFGFHAVWLPERHFHAFGGLSPNPAILAAMLATRTQRLRIRAGSVILPLHHPLRVAEEWSVIDNLSDGRVDLAFGTGWNPNDFVLAPTSFAARRDLTLSSIEVVRRLWRGEEIPFASGSGSPTPIKVYPAPRQPELAVWLTCSGGVERFIDAGANGHNVLTALLFQSYEELGLKIQMYRNARERHGYDPDTGVVSVMVHTFVADSTAQARELVRAPMLRYLESSADLWKHGAVHLAQLTPEARASALDFGFERYFAGSMFGSAGRCLATARRLKQAGANEICCLVDFGATATDVIAGLVRLNGVREQLQAEERARPPRLPEQAAAVHGGEVWSQ